MGVLSFSILGLVKIHSGLCKIVFAAFIHNLEPSLCIIDNLKLFLQGLTLFILLFYISP